MSDNSPMEPGWDPEEYEMVIPFVCVESTGGPYDDKSFVAGYRLGVMAQLMATGHQHISDAIYPEMVRQVDLFAMHYGYELQEMDWDTGDMRLITLSKIHRP